MKGFIVVSSLILLAASQLAYSRSITNNMNSLSDGWTDSGGGSSFVKATTETCEPIYGFLPCSTNVWGLLFMIVVYEVLLSIAGQYVATGSNLFFQIIGPGVLGGSVFQLLGTIPQLVLILVPLLTGTLARAQERATTGMAMVLGGVAMILTLVWGLSVILGSYDPSEDAEETDDLGSQKAITMKGPGVVTDVETSLTARLVLVAAVPFFILEFQNVFSSSSGKRVVILIALVVTVILLCSYILYQSFQPWIQNRYFEYMIDKFAKDKLLKLITRNGRPDTRKIQELFKRVDRDNTASVTAAEIRVLVLGVKIEDDATTSLDLDNITTYFDASGDGGISQEEFVKGMTRLASSLLDQTTTQTTKSVNGNSQITSEEQTTLLGSSTSSKQTSTNSWSIYFQAAFFVIFGTTIASALAEPLVVSVINFADAANMSSFCVSYLALPLALNYDTIVQSIASASQKNQKSNSLMLSSLYGSVFMNNMVGLMPFLAPVYFRNLTSDASAELLIVLLICIIMGLFTSFNTAFPRWTGYLVLSLYPISLLIIYLLTSVLGWA